MQDKIIQVCKAIITNNLLLIALFVFPPWKYDFPSHSALRNAGHHFILFPPPLKSSEEVFQAPGFILSVGFVRVYWTKLFCELLAVFLLSRGLAFIIEKRLLPSFLCLLSGSIFVLVSVYVFF